MQDISGIPSHCITLQYAQMQCHTRLGKSIVIALKISNLMGMAPSKLVVIVWIQEMNIHKWSDPFIYSTHQTDTLSTHTNLYTYTAHMCMHAKTTAQEICQYN